MPFETITSPNESKDPKNSMDRNSYETIFVKEYINKPNTMGIFKYNIMSNSQ